MTTVSDVGDIRIEFGRLAELAATAVAAPDVARVEELLTAGLRGLRAGRRCSPSCRPSATARCSATCPPGSSRRRTRCSTGRGTSEGGLDAPVEA
jgi:hypothetical protein